MVLREMGLGVRNACIHCDNAAAVSIANGSPPMRSRHWSMRAWSLNAAVSAGEVALVYIDTKEQQADTLTKNVSAELLRRHRDLLGGSLNFGFVASQCVHCLCVEQYHCGMLARFTDHGMSSSLAACLLDSLIMACGMLARFTDHGMSSALLRHACSIH
eukprot:6479095-Amphidinium_carterae.2